MQLNDFKHWEEQYSGVKIFPPDVLSSLSEDICSSCNPFNTSSPNTPDKHGLYPLIYSAALADPELFKLLLPCTNLELVHDVLCCYSTSLLNIIIEAPLRKVRTEHEVVEDNDTASIKCLEAYLSSNRFVSVTCMRTNLLAVINAIVIYIYIYIMYIVCTCT